MTLDIQIARLEENAQVFGHLVAGVGLEQARWKPAEDRWSILEVVCHLADEERFDFRARLRSLLEDTPPGATAGPIDPQRWAVERRYNERELGPSLGDFLRERGASLGWLRILGSPNWSRAHPQSGLRAGDVMASWLAHDDLHIKQITRLRYERLAVDCAPFAVEYAGEWR